MQLRSVAAALFCLFASAAHAQDARVVTTCGTLPQAYAAGSTQLPTVDVNGKLCVLPTTVSNLGGLGTGVATALGVNVGSAGAIVVNGGALGTPSSGALTNATGLPISTGVAGLGAGVAAALAIAPNATGGSVTAATGCTSWTPTDQSGASLTFTSVSAQFCQYGNLVIAYGTLTYPSTVDGSAAKISLPVAVPNQSYAAVPGQWFDRTGAGDILFATQGTSQAAVIAKAAGSAITNANLSTKVINFFIMYPAQ